MEYLGSDLSLLRLGARKLDHLGPLLGFFRDELAEVGCRAREHRGTHVGKPRVQLGIGESSVDFGIELLDDLGWRVLGCADAIDCARLIARHELAYGWQV